MHWNIVKKIGSIGSRIRFWRHRQIPYFLKLFSEESIRCSWGSDFGSFFPGALSRNLGIWLKLISAKSYRGQIGKSHLLHLRVSFLKGINPFPEASDPY